MLLNDDVFKAICKFAENHQTRTVALIAKACSARESVGALLESLVDVVKKDFWIIKEIETIFNKDTTKQIDAG